MSGDGWYSRQVGRAVEREKKRVAAIAGFRSLGPLESSGWQKAAGAMNAKGVRNEFGREWTWKTLRLFIQVQMAVHGEVFDVQGMHEGVKRLQAEGGRRRWLRATRSKDVRQAVMASESLKGAAELLNAKGLFARNDVRWTAETVKQFMERRHADELEVLESLEPDLSTTMEDVAKCVNAAGCRNSKGGEWTANSLRQLVRRENVGREKPLLDWMAGRKDMGRRKGDARDELARRVASVCRKAVEFDGLAEALNRAGLKTLQGQEWTGERLFNFDQGYRRAKGKRLLARVKIG